ncbi:MAG: GTP-binding protein [Candidatus Micrarchaeota archaeon]
MGIGDKIREIEDEMRRTQYHKGTEHHFGMLKAKLAKLKKELIKPSGKGKGGGFDIRRSGDASVVIIGFPSVGKSTLLNALTSAESKVAAYEFTTLGVVPGVMLHKGARIQILDLPGILEGASRGRGRGKEVLSVARSADLILILLDVFGGDKLDVIKRELHEMGIRINARPPRVVITPMKKDGVNVSSTVKMTKLDERMIQEVLGVYGIYNADVVVREDVDVDGFIDVVVGNRRYAPALVVVAKIDLVDEKARETIRRELAAKGEGAVLVSAEKKIGIKELRDKIYEKLDLMRIFTRPWKGEADLDEPMIIRRGADVEEVCNKLHRGLKEEFKHALIWGKSVKFGGQKVGLKHVLQDGDVVMIIKRRGGE